MGATWQTQEFSEVSVVPDLTWKQRQEEGDMDREAETRNENLTEVDVAKKLNWMVVGGK